MFYLLIIDLPYMTEIGYVTVFPTYKAASVVAAETTLHY